jgi:RsiW-degrading membrane proteinase PrsW (M82 family)
VDALQLVLLLAAALAPPVILSIRLRNAERRRREPWRVLWRAFAWGATIAAAIAVVAETLLDRSFAGAAIIGSGLSVTVVLVAPIVEEMAKTLGLGVIRDPDPEPEDGYIYGGAVGLGFAATENTIYILAAFALAGQETAFVTALYRGVATVALHGAASAIAGHGVWRSRADGRMGWAAWGLLAATALHVSYNALAGLAAGWATLAAAGVALVAYLRIVRRVRVLDEAG